MSNFLGPPLGKGGIKSENRSARSYFSTMSARNFMNMVSDPFGGALPKSVMDQAAQGQKGLPPMKENEVEDQQNTSQGQGHSGNDKPSSKSYRKSFSQLKAEHYNKNKYATTSLFSMPIEKIFNEQITEDANGEDQEEESKDKTKRVSGKELTGSEVIEQYNKRIQSAKSRDEKKKEV